MSIVKVKLLTQSLFLFYSVLFFQLRAYIVKAPDRRGLGGVFADVLLHPHHVVPAAELICAAREPADEAVTEVLMELLAVERQVFIRNRRVRDAGVDVRDVLQPQCTLERVVQKLAEPEMLCVGADIYA